MIMWAITKENGCIELAGISKSPPTGHKVLPVEPEFSDYLMWVDDGWVERPAFPDPVITNGRLLVENCPEGTTAFVYDAETYVHFGVATVENGSLDLELPDPGGYRIEIFPPEPWIKPEIFTVTTES